MNGATARIGQFSEDLLPFAKLFRTAEEKVHELLEGSGIKEAMEHISAHDLKEAIDRFPSQSTPAQAASRSSNSLST
ncbi:MAG: hypothetical protein CMM93_08870 [Rickettsiales bacterium]|nr:hypothetical protein [Rickettsiales bacterium]|tara:strand:- start:390 stop:620 length:231 start_codon:yes stop_codon:yes gene_type:complete